MARRPLQFDPALKELVFRRTGRAWDRQRIAGSAPLIPVIVKLLDPSARIPGLRTVARFGQILTGRVRSDRIEALRRHRQVLALKAARRVFADDNDPFAGLFAARATARDIRSGGPRSVTGKSVNLVFIDWYCDFGHANFRNADGSTRLAFLWDQRGPNNPKSPIRYNYGRLFTGPEIDAALRRPDPYAALDYDPAKSPGAARGSHGTHVMDIAAGNGRATGSLPGIAPEARLGFVHLRASDYSPHDTLGDSVRLLEAVRFAVDATAGRPTVINLSMGDHGGPHDGSTLVEQAFDAVLAERPGLAIVMSTGNYFSSNVHMSKWIAQGQTIELPWQVRRGRRTPSELEVWYAGDDRLTATLVDPSGRDVLTVAPGEDRHRSRGSDRLISAYSRLRDSGNGDNHLDVFLGTRAAAGTWTVRLRGNRIKRGIIHAWVERTGSRSQTRFDTRHTLRTTTTNTICNGQSTIATGAFDGASRDLGLARFSSSGPTRDGRRKPDVSAPGVRVRAARSTFKRNGARIGDTLVEKSGTSMAAPHVAGTIALLFESAAPRLLSIDETRQALFAGLVQPEGATSLDRMRYGVGLLDTDRVLQSFTRSQSAAGQVATPAVAAER